MSDLTLQVGVKILLENNEGKFLLLHRSAEKYENIVGRWDMVGGRIDTGISLMENLQREVSEETGLTIVGEPELIAAQDILRKPGFHVVRLSYLGKAEGEIKLDTSENDEYKWYSREEIEILEDMDVYLKELVDNKAFWK
jgi:ADP-ribose pyrophosphatase YjhB (NUDIX family)